MNKNQTFSLYFIIGLFVFFLVLSFITDNWKFALWSFVPCFTGMMTSIMSNKLRS